MPDTYDPDQEHHAFLLRTERRLLLPVKLGMLVLGGGRIDRPAGESTTG